MSVLAPVALVDKSMLQTLRPAEAALFDGLFEAVIPPTLLSEIASDLAKEDLSNSTPEDFTGVLAGKLPEVRGSLSEFHATAGTFELLGGAVPMKFRPLPTRRGARDVGDSGATVFSRQEELSILRRWRERKFTETELSFAAFWRETCHRPPRGGAFENLRRAEALPIRVKDMAEAREAARRLVQTRPVSPELLFLVVSICVVPPAFVPGIFERFNSLQRSLQEACPFVAHMASVEVFYRLILNSGNIVSPDPKVTFGDRFYLYYLPFCGIFLSGDKFHRRAAPLFMEAEQEFVDSSRIAPELKLLAEHFEKQAKDSGVVPKLPRSPIGLECPEITKLWDRFLPGWKEAEVKAKTESGAAPDFIKEALASGKVKSVEDMIRVIREAGGEVGPVIQREVRERREGFDQT